MAQNRFVISFSFICLGALLLVYWPFISQQRDFASGDLVFIYEPVCRYFGEALSQGRIPLWNDLIHSGMPQIAVISPGLFYPPNWLLFFLPFSRGLSFFMIFHQLLLSAAFYFYLRRLGISPVSSLLTGICAGLSGFMFAVLKTPDYAGVAWIPLLCLMIRVFFSSEGTKKVCSFFMIVLSSSLLILSGRPEYFVPGLSLAFLQGLAELITAFKERVSFSEVTKNSLVLFAGALAGVLLSAPIILPELEWLQWSHRSSGLSANELFAWSSNWYSWLSLFFWEPLGDMQLVEGVNEFFPLLFKDMPNLHPFLASFYMGADYCLLLIIGLLNWRWRPWKYFLSLVFFWALLSAGNQTPFAPLFFAVFPKLAIVRYPIKILIIPILLSVPLAARGLDLLIEKSSGRVALILLFLIAACGIFLLNIPGLNICSELLLQMSRAAGTTLSSQAMYIGSARLFESLQTGSILIIAFSALCLLHKMGLFKETLFCSLISPLLLLPLLMNGIETGYRSSAFGFYERAPSLIGVLNNSKNESPQKGRIAIFESGSSVVMDSGYVDKMRPLVEDVVTAFVRDEMEYNTSMDTGERCSTGYDLSEIGSYVKLRALTERRSRRNDNEKIYGGRELEESREKLDLPYARFCTLSATDYVMRRQYEAKGKALRSLACGLFTMAAEDPLTGARLYRLRQPAKRFYFAERLQAIKDFDHFLYYVFDTSNKDSFDPTAAYIETESYMQVASLLKDSSASTEAGQLSSEIRLLSDAPEKIVLGIKKRRPGLLVIRDQFYPGWRATIDGVECRINKVNMVNRGIVVPAGSHEIVLEYLPQSFFLGLKIACAAILLTVALSFFLCFGSKREEVLS